MENLESMQVGDLVWFGDPHPDVALEDFIPHYVGDDLANWRDFPVNHVAVYTGVREDDYMFLHASLQEGTTTVWSLSKFEEYPRYQKIYGIRRLRTT